MHHHREMRTKVHHVPDDVVGDDFRQAFVNKRFVNNITDDR